MPDKRERDLWWAFVEGKPESEWNPPKRLPANRQIHGKQKMRAFPDRELENSEVVRDVWHINDEGEVELALRPDGRDSLPTPSGSPLPPETSSAADQKHTPEWKRREPTPSLMRDIDHVRVP
jgi:hypothetical protein